MLFTSRMLIKYSALNIQVPSWTFPIGGKTHKKDGEQVLCKRQQGNKHSQSDPLAWKIIAIPFRFIYADGCAHDAVFTERFDTPDSRAPVYKQYLSNGSRARCDN